MRSPGTILLANTLFVSQAVTVQHVLGHDAEMPEHSHPQALMASTGTFGGDIEEDRAVHGGGLGAELPPPQIIDSREKAEEAEFGDGTMNSVVEGGVFTISLQAALKNDGDAAEDVDAPRAGLGLGPQIRSRVTPEGRLGLGPQIHLRVIPESRLRSGPQIRSRATPEGEKSGAPQAPLQITTSVSTHNTERGGIGSGGPGHGILEPVLVDIMDALGQRVFILCLLIVLVFAALGPSGGSKGGQHEKGWLARRMHRQNATERV
mmetsp:Transcript_93100/g.216362  ORF Transcript_93100/g.216362 Transcript_93100/m.216362 type:complete len:263 (-) Transcript_93100:98-886(-)|eukprot:CAMPEP_0171102510 /NCGR_PEP_ID=MMETSP0766_2-20121228/58024_1 /TAXON_ID=439317 /ORGANISM="Gambierdiscus australes, Strain CAWD 149" /LENGTH=262 /DNA_ID=CAMNT_0011562827 /DNA_START=114 /DNA_END=902 /DNA_ORIENTATION=+